MQALSADPHRAQRLDAGKLGLGLGTVARPQQAGDPQHAGLRALRVEAHPRLALAPDLVPVLLPNQQQGQVPAVEWLPGVGGRGATPYRLVEFAAPESYAMGPWKLPFSPKNP